MTRRGWDRASARPWLAVLMLIAAGSGVAAEEPSPAEFFERQNGQWFEKIAPGGRVRVVNPNGNVYARFGGYQNEVEILATIQRLDAAAKVPEVVITRTEAGGLEVTTRVEAASAAPHKKTGRVDLVVFVPKGAPLDVETVDDLIEVRKLQSDFNASSVKGEVRFRGIEGRVQAKSARGGIVAALESGATTEAQSLTTETGEIEVWLWEDAKMLVDLATSGEIGTDFSMTIEHRRFEEPGKYATSRLGDGGPTLTLRSKRGRIRVLRQQRDFRPDDQH